MSGHSGVRAFLPTFLLSLLSLVRPDLVELSGSMSWLKHPASASVSGVLAAAEMAASMIPAIENIVQTVMTFVHPIMGVVNAIAPNLGDQTAYTQGPMAVFGGSQALIFHLIKLLMRALGLGFLGPCLACLEHCGVLVLVPLAILFGSFAIAVAALLLFAVARWIYRVVATNAPLLGTDADGKDRRLLPKASKLESYVRREHSVLSIYYLREDDGLPRPHRAALLCAMLFAQLYFVAELLQTTISPIGQDILVALALVPVRAVSKALLRAAAKADADAMPARAAVVGAALLVLWLYAAVVTLVELQPHAAGLVVVNFATSLFISWVVFEPLELVFLFKFCKTCCPCCAFCFIDDSAIEEEGEEDDDGGTAKGAVV
ncbi:hypothetical protein CTAYLR_008560 [Chrysophaeum taylorii]|uniref:DUF4126 domain-containing protein n=1 Tax=Chrysophaeum taylorii TaxID=2483200 RepID=A0AAD7U8J7_9STRA|nr:hypothetical protein CTAYLR_008560 [Chrysophaeum taylorii]